MSDMQVLYVAGPYRDCRGPAYIWDNIMAARVVAMELWKMGFTVVCPHLNTFMMDGIVADDAQWLEGDKEIISRLDGLVLLPGWERSVGSTAERIKAFECAKPVYYWPQHKEFLTDLAAQCKPLVSPAEAVGTFVDKPKQLEVGINGNAAVTYDVIMMDDDNLVLRKHRQHPGIKGFGLGRSPK